MADVEEENYSEPTPATMSGPAKDPAAASFAAGKEVALNSARATTGAAVGSAQAIATLPKLPVVKLMSYSYNPATKQVRQEELDGVEVNGFLFERATGYDFMLMRVAAAMDGITLEPTSTYRTMQQQIDIYNDRWLQKYPAFSVADHYAKKNKLSFSGMQKGQAAYPGTSNHQSGKAIDINVGLTVAEFASRKGKKNDIYRWLEKNAKQFGFDNDEVLSEPWHWRHQSSTIVGSISGLAVEGLRKADLEAQAKNANAGGARIFSLAEAYDAQRAADRSDPALTGRRALLALAVAGKLHAAADKATKAAIAQARANPAALATDGTAAAASGGATPTAAAASAAALGMTPGTESAGFDFKTGLWGDGRPV